MSTSSSSTSTPARSQAAIDYKAPQRAKLYEKIQQLIRDKHYDEVEELIRNRCAVRGFALSSEAIKEAIELLKKKKPLPATINRIIRDEENLTGDDEKKTSRLHIPSEPIGEREQVCSPIPEEFQAPRSFQCKGIALGNIVCSACFLIWQLTMIKLGLACDCAKYPNKMCKNCENAKGVVCSCEPCKDCPACKPNYGGLRGHTNHCICNPCCKIRYVPKGSIFSHCQQPNNTFLYDVPSNPGDDIDAQMASAGADSQLKFYENCFMIPLAVSNLYDEKNNTTRCVNDTEEEPSAPTSPRSPDLSSDIPIPLAQPTPPTAFTRKRKHREEDSDEEKKEEDSDEEKKEEDSGEEKTEEIKEEKTEEIKEEKKEEIAVLQEPANESKEQKEKNLEEAKKLSKLVKEHMEESFGEDKTAFRYQCTYCQELYNNLEIRSDEKTRCRKWIGEIKANVSDFQKKHNFWKLVDSVAFVDNLVGAFDELQSCYGRPLDAETASSWIASMNKAFQRIDTTLDYMLSKL